MMSLYQTFQHYLQHVLTAVGSIKFGFGEAIYLKQKVQRFQSRYCNGLLGSQIRKALIIPAATLGSQVQSPVFSLQSSLAAFRTLQCFFACSIYTPGSRNDAAYVAVGWKQRKQKVV